MSNNVRKTIEPMPFRYFATVASAGMVAFIAFWEGFFSLIAYHPCTLQNPDYTIQPNPRVALIQFGLSVVALFVLFMGAKRLQKHTERGILPYLLVIINLLVGEGLLSFIFIKLSSNCVG
jgi:hypothetical protein